MVIRIRGASVSIRPAIKSGKGGETNIRSAASRRRGQTSVFRISGVYKHESARHGDAGDRRGTHTQGSSARAEGTRINPVVGALIGVASAGTRATLHILKRRRRAATAVEERSGRAKRLGPEFILLTPLSPCPMSYKWLAAFTRVVSLS